MITTIFVQHLMVVFARMVRYDYMLVILLRVVDWKYAMMGYGVLYVMNSGLLSMQKLPVTNLDYHPKVTLQRCNAVCITAMNITRSI